MTWSGSPVDALVAEIGSTTTVVSAFAGLSRLPGDDALPGRAGRRRHVGRRRRRHHRRERRPGAAGGGRRVLGPARAHAGDQLGGRRPAHDRPRPHAADDGDGRARGGAGGRRAWSSTRPPAGCATHDLREIDAVRPNLILLAGGVEGGDCDTVLFNAEQLAQLEARPIVVYAGNSRRLRRRAGAAGAGRLPGQAHQQRLSGRRRARHRAGPRTSSTTRSRSTSRTRRAWSASARS